MTDWNETIQKMNQRQEDEELLHRKRLEEEREQERLEQEAAMTDTTDYTQRPEVLAACGWRWNVTHSCWSHNGLILGGGFPIEPTMQELWDGLCKACKGTELHPHLYGDEAVELLRHGQVAKYVEHEFLVRDYGTLANTIAAALYTVLQQATPDAPKQTYLGAYKLGFPQTGDEKAADAGYGSANPYGEP